MNTQIRKHFKGTIQQYVFEVMNKTLCDEKGMRVRLIVFDAIFNNISVISWWSVLFLEETGVPGVPSLVSELRVYCSVFFLILVLNALFYSAVWRHSVCKSETTFIYLSNVTSCSN
jgi:hypothetical protein